MEHGGESVLAHYSLGLAALQCRSAECEAQQATEEAARKEFLRTVELFPDFPDALSFLGYTEMSTGASLEDAEQHLKAAIKLIPGREDYRFHLAQVYMRMRRFDEAQALLGPIAASREAAQRERARQMLAQLATMKTVPAAPSTITSFDAPSTSSTSSDAPAGHRAVTGRRGEVHAPSFG